MNTPPLAILQARWGSTRLPGKMGKDLGGYPLVWWAWNAAVVAFGPENVVVAMPATRENDDLARIVGGFGGEVFRWDGPENDVLGRFIACALTYRWDEDVVIARVTPDDWRKNPLLMQRVVNGERLPVEVSCEAFTLEMLLDATEWATTEEREHLTLLFDYPPPKAPESDVPWSIDTAADLDAARDFVAQCSATHMAWLGGGARA